MNSINRTWTAIENTHIPSGNLAARIAVPELTERLYCGLDSDRKRHFLIPLTPTDGEFVDRTSRGLLVKAKDMTIAGSPVGRYLDIECQDRAGHDAFDLIGNNIAKLLNNVDQNPIDIVAKVLGKWRRFWGQPSRAVLSKETIIGLFGELWFLSKWLMPMFGSGVVDTWRGPFGSRHDFEWTNRSVEVKTTTSTRGRIHHIHGLNQMEKPEGGPLYLFSLRLYEESGATECLTGIIDNCTGQLSSDADRLCSFENALINIGYSPLQAEEYEGLRFRIVEEALFDVREDFPRISAADFKEGISSSIERVDYIINLNSFDRLCLTRTPDDLSHIFV